MLACFDPGMELASAEYSKLSVPVLVGEMVGGGMWAAHTAQVADGLTQSQPSTAALLFPRIVGM